MFNIKTILYTFVLIVMFGQNRQMQELILSREQLQKNCFLLIDTIHRTVSSAEKYALGNYPNKKYGYWDELDTANIKSENDLRIEFLVKIQTVIGAINEFKKLYPDVPIPFYDKIPKEVIINDLVDFKNIVLNNKKKKKDASLYDTFINLLNDKKYNIISKQEFLNYISPNEEELSKVGEEQVREYAAGIFQQKIYANNEVQNAVNQIKINGSYQPGEIGMQPGRGYPSHHHGY